MEEIWGVNDISAAVRNYGCDRRAFSHLDGVVGLHDQEATLNGNILVNLDIDGSDTERGISSRFLVDRLRNCNVTSEVDVAGSNGKELLEVNNTKPSLSFISSIYIALVYSHTLCLREVEHGISPDSRILEESHIYGIILLTESHCAIVIDKNFVEGKTEALTYDQ